MGEFQEINQGIQDDLMERLEEEDYNMPIGHKALNRIADIIDSRHSDPKCFKDLVKEAKRIIRETIDEDLLERLNEDGYCTIFSNKVNEQIESIIDEKKHHDSFYFEELVEEVKEIINNEN